MRTWKLRFRLTGRFGLKLLQWSHVRENVETNLPLLAFTRQFKLQWSHVRENLWRPADN